MPVSVFAAQPWESQAAQHQRQHPGAWTPELAETTSVWAEVVRAVVRFQELPLQGGPPQNQAAQVHAFVSDRELHERLRFLRERGMHGLLVAWVMEGVRERLINHAVPAFWQHYYEDQESAREGGGGGGGGPAGAASMRRGHNSFFVAISDLATFVGAQLQLVALLDGHLGASANGAASGDDAAAAAARLPYSFPRTAHCIELTTALQAYARAPAGLALELDARRPSPTGHQVSCLPNPFPHRCRSYHSPPPSPLPLARTEAPWFV